LTLAIFDLDHTLLAGDSDYAWGEFLIEKGIVDKEEYKHKNEQYYQAYTEGALDIHRFLAFVLQPLMRLDRATLDALHKDYMQAKIRPMITPAARQLVQDHRAQGHFPLIISATNSFITRPIAREFGVDDLLATEPEEIDGRFTGKVVGVPCFREGKVTRLKAWCQEHGESLNGSWCYSDSHNDLPLLTLVQHPVAVDPDEQLRRHAEQQGWRIMSLR